MEFSALHRGHFISRLKSEEFDLLIIGGGITGCGIALDAASRGLRVALLEKNDFAFGTSSRSTKLIHGGLRYLKQFEFGLVKEVGSERAIVHNLAPHLVVPEKMLLPLYEKKGLGYWLTSIGLKIYDWLAGVKSEDQRKMLTRVQTLKAEPLLRQEDVKGGALYAEYRTDDARLTIEIAKTAVKYGAILLNYAEVKDFTYQNGLINGVEAIDHLGEHDLLIRTRSVVNAAGPWVDALRKSNQSLHGKRLRLSKGVHIVVAREKLPIKQAIYFDVDDGRMIFAIPRARITYVGTTDTFYDGSLDTVVAKPDDAKYLLDAVNSTFPAVGLTFEDIESSWAGLRPLIFEEGKSAGDLSRKDEIFESPSGLISIAGGKLTGYRKMAERVVNLVVKKFFTSTSFKPCHTESIPLVGSNSHKHTDLQHIRQTLTGHLRHLGVENHILEQLLENFGPQSLEIVNIFLTLERDDDPRLTLLKAQLKFCLRHEMIETLCDFFIRRTGLVYFNIGNVLSFKDIIASVMARELSWTPERSTEELRLLNEAIRQAQVKNF